MYILKDILTPTSGVAVTFLTDKTFLVLLQKIGLSVFGGYDVNIYTQKLKKVCTLGNAPMNMYWYTM